MEYIFVVGCAKTGSKLIRQILMTHPDVDILAELHFLVPRWIKKDFVHHAREIGPLAVDRNVRALVDLMYSNRLAGSFWRTDPGRRLEESPGRIDDLDPERLQQAILRSDRSYRAVMQILLEEHAARTGRRVAGAKFPVNIAHTPTLIGWFPGCRVVHLVRDPRAIYTSMVKMSEKRSRVALLRSEKPAQAARLYYAVQQYRHSGRVHAAYANEPFYHLLRFEDVIREPETTIRALCDFLGLEFRPAMCEPQMGVGSNYGDSSKAQRGFDARTLERWKEHIPRAGRAIIESLLKKEIATFGYRAPA